MRSLIRIPVALSALALLGTSALAHGEKKGQQPGKAGSSTQEQSQKVSSSKKQSQLRQVGGTIAKIKQVEVRGANTKNTVVMLKTNKNNRRLAVDLGPTQSIPAERLKVGKQIQVEGRPVQIRDHRFLVASRFKTEGKTMNIERKTQAMQHQKASTQQAGKAGEFNS